MIKHQQSYVVIMLLLLCQPLIAQVLFEPQSQTGSAVGLTTGPQTVHIQADSQQRSGEIYHMVGNVQIDYRDVELTADHADYNLDTGELLATGNVHFTQAAEHEDMHASRADYNVKRESGQFYDVQGSVGGLVRPKPSMLTSSNPFYFTAKRMDRLEPGVFRLYNAVVTICSPPRPTWTFRTPMATIHAGEGAWVEHAQLRLLQIPIFYFPIFYHSLRPAPRNSGFLMPVIGSNSSWGTVAGDSYFWAINRSMDAEIGGELLSKRGWAQQLSFRARPASGDFFRASYYGVVDRLNQGGSTAHAEGAGTLPDSFRGILDFNYLSSLTFREAFAQTFSEAVNSEVHSSGALTKNFDSYSFNILASQLENFQGLAPGNTVRIRTLPEAQFDSVDRPLWQDSPLWFSLDSSLGLLSRREPAAPNGTGLETGPMERAIFYPKVSLPLNWGWVHLTSTVGFRAAQYSKQKEDGAVVDQNLREGATVFSLDWSLPALERTYSNAGPLWRHPFRHVVEPRVIFRDTTGVHDFANIPLFDESDLVTDTREVEYSVTQRLFIKDSTGSPREVFSWELKQQYYFDPTFGGALVTGSRNVILSSLELSGVSFLDGPRRFSPVVSVLQFRPLAHYELDVQDDYDPTQHVFTRGEITGSVHLGKSFFSANHSFIRSSPILNFPSNQVSFTTGYGSLERKGWNVAASAAYDIKSGYLQYTAFQGSYNNNCCGISFEYRRFAISSVSRNENQYRVSFSLANVGTFGTLKKQDRLF